MVFPWFSHGFPSGFPWFENAKKRLRRVLNFLRKLRTSVEEKHHGLHRGRDQLEKKMGRITGVD
jgi:hypothetical protein